MTKYLLSSKKLKKEVLRFYRETYCNIFSKTLHVNIPALRSGAQLQLKWLYELLIVCLLSTSKKD